jgi:tRNA threonylcarbamoyladenosine biosynthesis protein TsaE
VSAGAGDLAPVRLRTASEHDTRALGAALARGLRPGDVVLLTGELGAGKTTLAQGIGMGLGVTDQVTSPTFTLVRTYPCPPPTDPGPGTGSDDAPAVRAFLHADLYRLEHTGEVVDLAIGELVEDGAVAVVEWGEVAAPVLGDDAMSVRLAPGPDDDGRSVTVTVTERWAARYPGLARLLSEWGAP